MLKLTWPYPKIKLSNELLNSLYRYALSLSHDEHHAYDLLQNSCEKILSVSDKSKLTDQQQLKSYMQRIIRNDFIDQYRRHKLELIMSSDQENIDNKLAQQTSQSLESILIDQEHVAILLQQLTSQERELLYLWAVEGNTFQELAEQTNTPKGTLLARLSRLRKRLQKQYGYLNTRAHGND